ncbi:Spy/CpxP family protein refolding chaperone [Jannaschia sp. CCS1]|uniref:Spy/CpxP family protein refolding chaperone n=1 Tax=Jannaschia sp. (strain CCS1) TaxID=290400 RepID=UPI000053DA64|nr:Spy/CpxP family protein refolding chaperone [Jannaschia sp. CCS1]ABD54932.1 hypothetical protein Jann_2015 [Jannaschia sp. CCS1]
MTDQNDSNKKWYKTGRGRLFAGIAAAACIVLGAQAIAQTRPAQHLAQFVSDGGTPEFMEAQFRPGHGHGFGPGRGSPFEDMSEEEIDRMVARGVAHAAIELGATDAQRDQITEIVVALVQEMRPLADGFREAATELQSLLLAEDVDAEALEAIRAERLAEADRVSREMVTALTEIAGILTAEQRQTAAERIEFFREMRERRRGED